jgi:acyl-homoserine-lactone acylase
MAADADGNIFYIHGNAVPARDTAVDWTRPVDGTTSRTEWRGYHDLADLPQALNPASGWLQNTNSTPYLASGDEMSATSHPRYMAPEADNARARRSRAILSADSAWTLEKLATAAFDTRVEIADAEIDRLTREWEEVGGTNPQRAFRLDPVMDRLRAWDRVSTVTSTEMTLFMTWQERIRTGEYEGAYGRFRALEDAVALMQRDHGSTEVEWGSVNRLQRPPIAPVPAFNDDHHSLPVAGAPGWTGVIFAFAGRQPPGSVRRYGTSGHTWVSVVELAGPPVARSVVTFGQSGDRNSDHWFDQAALYARGEMKPAPFTPADVAASARRTYRPGR